MTTRKAFIAAGALAAAAVPLVSNAAAPQTSPAAASSAGAPPKLAFDIDAFHTLLERSVTHKHCYVATKINGGDVFQGMRNTLKAYNDIGTPLSDVLPVAVFYHGPSIALAFDDTIWNDYLLPLTRMTSLTRQEPVKDLLTVTTPSTTGNPLLQRQGGVWDPSIPSLVADAGAKLFVCNNATYGFANTLGLALKKEPAEIYDRLLHHLVPNAMMVPAGVWAVHAIQERRFTLLQTSN